MNRRLGIGNLSSIESFRLGRSFLVDLDVDLEQMLNWIPDELLLIPISIESNRQQTYTSALQLSHSECPDVPYCVPQSPR